MATKANPDESAAKRRNTILTKTKEELTKQKEKYRGVMKATREAKVPNAMLNTGIAATGGILTGAARGLVPDTITVMEREIPLGLVRDGGGVIVGVLTGVGSAFVGFEPGIHFGGGIFTVCTAGLAEKGVAWVREQVWTEGMKMWNER